MGRGGDGMMAGGVVIGTGINARGLNRSDGALTPSNQAPTTLKLKLKLL